MNPPTSDVLQPVTELFPGREPALRALLTPCVGHKFRLQPPRSDLAAVVQRAFAWHTPTAPALRYESLYQPFDVAGHHRVVLIEPKRTPREVTPRFKVLGELAQTIWERLGARQMCDLSDALWGKGSIGPELGPRFTFVPDPWSGVRWELLNPQMLGEQLQDNLDECMAVQLGCPRIELPSHLRLLEPWEIREQRRCMLQCWRDCLTVAVGCTCGALTAEAECIPTLLHELWLAGNFPIQLDGPYLYVVCAKPQPAA